MKRIVSTIFLILININLGRSQGDLDYNQAMNFFFSDLEILMNGNDDGFSFGDILREFNGKNLMPDASIKVLENPDGSLIMEYGPQFIMQTQFATFDYYSKGSFDKQYFFPKKDNFATNVVDKIFYGSNNSFKSKGNIFKIMSIFSSINVDENEFENYFQRIKYQIENRLNLYNYAEYEFDNVDLDKYNVNYGKVKMPYVSGKSYVKKNIIYGSESFSDYKYPVVSIFLSKTKKYDDKGNILNFIVLESESVVKSFEITDKRIDQFIVNGNDFRKINTYQLDQMIDMFFDDCEANNIFINRDQNILTEFKELEGTTLALAYGIENDKNIAIQVDPVEWDKASLARKWYTIYHELGHDVLNLYHGDGGKMMFNFADIDYSWNQFFEDKKFMFDIYKKKNNLNDETLTNKAESKIKSNYETEDNLDLNSSQIKKYKNDSELSKTTLFYDSEWRGCNEDNAIYYREVYFDKSGSPVGEIRDYYYKSKKIQSVIEGAIRVNKFDDRKSIFIGKATGYDELGNITFEMNIKKKTLFYDENRMGCDKDDAYKYRVFYQDELSGRPIGEIRDYNIETNKLIAIIPGANKIDEFQDSKSTFFGIIKTYDSNGQLSRQFDCDGEGNCEELD